MTTIFNPRQTILISCRGTAEYFGVRKEVDELFPCDWHSPISFTPPMYSICISKNLTLSLELIREASAFVVNFMSFENKDAVLKCSKDEGKFIDKFESSGLTKEDAVSIDAPRVKECVGFLECELTGEHEYGDHILFIGRVVNSDLKDALAKRIFHKSEGEFTTTK